jgi:DNA repair ATPase RecN
MNKSIKILFLLLVMSIPVSIPALVVAADKQHMPAGSQVHSSQATHMMSHEMMRHMSGVMQHMHTMTRDMNRIMENTAAMDQTRTREMARIMEQLSQAMHNMSQHMEKGDMDEKMLREMKQHMNQISNMVKNMEQKAN